MPGIELTKKWYFTIFGKMTMTKGVYDHGLTPFRGFCPWAKTSKAFQKAFSFSKVFFFTFYRIIPEMCRMWCVQLGLFCLN